MRVSDTTAPSVSGTKVVRELTVAEIDKALRNLERIEAYLSPRAGRPLPPEGAAAIEAMRRSVARLDARLRPSTEALEPPPSDQPPAASDADELDVAQLVSFASYLDRLEQWCAGCSAVLPSGAGSESGRRLLGSLAAVRQALEAIGTGRLHASDEPLEQDPVEAAPPRRQAPGRGATSSPAVDDVYDGASRRDPPPGPARQIALTSGDVDPMFTWVGPEDVELTARAREQIEQLFAEQGVTYFRYQLENFAEEVRRRIRSAPEGHVLVIKVREIGGERKPFLSYVAESSLAGGS